MPRPALIAALLVPLTAAIATTPATAEPVFTPGQMWSIQSPKPTPAKLVVVRIEHYGDETAIHVSVFDVPVPPGAPNAGSLIRIAHMPFAEAALAASVDQLLTTDAPAAPNFDDGYNNWRDAKGGIFTISVSEAIDLAFQAITRPNAPN